MSKRNRILYSQEQKEAIFKRMMLVHDALLF